MVSSIDCETWEGEHKTFYHKNIIYFALFSKIEIFGEKSKFQLLFNSDQYSWCGFLKRELCKGLDNYVFLNIKISIAHTLSFSNYNADITEL